MNIFWKILRKIGIVIFGAAFCLAGIVMIFTPGPGWVAIFAGLAALSTEFPWAKKVMRFLMNMLLLLIKITINALHRVGLKVPAYDRTVEKYMRAFLNKLNKSKTQKSLPDLQ